MLNYSQSSTITTANPSTAAAINSATLPRYAVIIASMLILAMLVMLGLTGCGQKGELYLVDASSQTVTTSSEALDSTSNPQDAAFANLGDEESQRTHDLEQQQMLSDINDDPNDY